MKKQQVILIASGFLLLVILFFAGKTIPPSKDKNKNSTTSEDAHNHAAKDFNGILDKLKEQISFDKKTSLELKEKQLLGSATIEQKIRLNKDIAAYWKDSIRSFIPYAFYTAEASKLENSEKSLTFAAQLFTERLITESSGELNQWFGNNGKDLLDRVLKINPNNDSAKIGIGACYILGDISNSPMEGILPVREIAQKNPDNLYAQLVLGLGGIKSKQYTKAIERFKIIVEKDSHNIEAIFHLAECYEALNDKTNAIVWYNAALHNIKDTTIKKEIEKRINDIK